jgi:hypothetical protein
MKRYLLLLEDSRGYYSVAEVDAATKAEAVQQAYDYPAVKLHCCVPADGGKKLTDF